MTRWSGQAVNRAVCILGDWFGRGGSPFSGKRGATECSSAGPSNFPKHHPVQNLLDCWCQEKESRSTNPPPPKKCGTPNQNMQVSILFFPSINTEVCFRCHAYFYLHGRRLIITTEQIFTQNEALPQRGWLAAWNSEIFIVTKDCWGSNRARIRWSDQISYGYPRLEAIKGTRHNSCRGMDSKLDAWQIVALNPQGSTVIIKKAHTGKATKY